MAGAFFTSHRLRVLIFAFAPLVRGVPDHNRATPLTPPLEDVKRAELLHDWAVCQNATMVPFDLALLVYAGVQHANSAGISGDILEAGVWKGGMCCLMARSQVRAGRVHMPRRIWLYDTFEGLPPPSDKDDERAHRTYAEVQAGSDHGGLAEDGKWNYGPQDVVKATMRLSGYPNSMLRYVKGKVEDTLSDPALERPSRLAVLRLDTDFYSSTLVELDVLWNLLSPGGMMYVDDYYVWGGSRTAVDEWLENRGWRQAATAAKAFGFDPDGTPQRLYVWKSPTADTNPTRPFVLASSVDQDPWLEPWL